MERFDHYFENHIAKIVDLESATIIDYYNPDFALQYNLRFIFDKKNSTLCITGDFGNLTAHNFYNLGDYHKAYKHFCNNVGYFVEKIRCCSRNIYTDDKNVSNIIYLYLDAYRRAYEYLIADLMGDKNE
ncbi:TPA: hypothetical protein ACJSX9_000169 [Streptococcus agalactiae]|uniref:hypothetical protein n=1 Tax=Streptococcus agalactiae TaxID=1311 RepID=UPI000694CB63|nr:hypothetical protein [Streptococcus agalactiae]HEM9180004.1 hypothetical protein [Streptococcus agalactiae]HEM9367780.1 hypothetical protein [Streptococcus agalactiae]HEN3163866.1 hypothetical protein [Streptococcus agalactiae]HEN3176391.1 hypothetical protein [Streptococcus agalactiae]HEN3178658.1 hypothetical protein [Streptococcus agalactiae]